MNRETDPKLKSLEQAVKDAEQLRNSVGLTAVIGLFVGGPVGFAIGGSGYATANKVYEAAVKQLEEYKSKTRKYSK